MSLSDTDFVSLVADCSAVLALQTDIKKKMSDAIFGMAIARKGGCAVSPDYIREDFDASVTVSRGDSGYELWERKPDMDPLLLISGLPPPSLKKAQQHFKGVVQSVVELANIVSKIEKLRCELGVAPFVDGLIDDLASLKVTHAAIADKNDVSTDSEN